MYTAMHDEPSVERRTGELFGQLWPPYDRDAFEASVALFRQRWVANGEDPDYFVGRRCLDVGCGGGRYTIALARLGAEHVIGVDVGEPGLEDARRRAEALGLGADRVEFRWATALALPFPDASFDFVCCSGVLHHTPNVAAGLAEIHRVLRPGGSAYLLLYGDGGLYWPLTLVMRPLAATLGVAETTRCIEAAGLSPAKRRTILDDLFVPLLETYGVPRVDALLADAGFARWRRWRAGQLDHESSPETLVDDLDLRAQVWAAGAATAPDVQTAAAERELAQICRAVVDAARGRIADHEAGRLSAAALRTALVGTGHHRIVAERT